MPATSPYANNDYTGVSSFRPFQLPINDIFKGLTAQNQFWDEGALKVKNAYEGALNLNLTSEENKKVRDQFMQDADKQMTKLSSMDVSDPGVQRQGLNIFTPLLKDTAIKFDNGLTELKQSILSTAESYKFKRLDPKGEVGEGYSQSNLMDALDGFQNFNSKTGRDPANLEKMYNELRDKEYVPYYNYNKEFQDVLSKCKGVTTEEPGSQEGYLTETLRSGADPARIRECLTYSLTDKARGQIGIEGRVNFKNGDGSINHQALAQSYNSRYQEDLHGLSLKDQQLIADAAYYDKMFADTGDAKWKEASDLTTKLRTSNKERISNLTEGYDKINTGDLDYINKNYNKLATGIYYNNLVDGFSQAFDNQSVKKKVQADPIYLLNMRLNGEYENARKLEDQKFEHQKITEMMKLGLKFKGNGTLYYAPIDPTQVKGDLVNNGLSEMSNQIKELSDQKIGILQEFYNANVKKDWEANGGGELGFYNNTNHDIVDASGQVAHPGEITPQGLRYLSRMDMDNNEAYLNLKDSLRSINLKLTISNQLLENVNNDPQVVNLSRDWKSKVTNKSEFPDVALPDGTIVSAVTMQNMLDGSDPNNKIIVGKSGLGTGTRYTVKQFIINGRIYDAGLVLSNSNFRTLHSLYEKVALGNDQNNAKILEIKNKKIGEALIVQEGRVFGDYLNNKEDLSHVRTRVQTGLGIPGLSLDDVKIRHYNPKTGKATVSVVKPTDKNVKLPTLEDVQTYLTEMSVDRSKYATSFDEGANLVFDIVSKDLIDPNIVQNRYLGAEDELNQYANVIRLSNMAPGIKDEAKAIEMPSSRERTTSYLLQPYKSSNGEVLWDISLKDVKTNTYKPRNKAYSISQVLSVINTN